jgi:hypothetical protein
MDVNIRHFFPGGNTTKGFHSFFDHIINKEEANHLFCFKGGPGTGKSSMMKKIGTHFFELGYNVEHHHCSSDPDSLDAVVIPSLKVALLDATAPHIVDPKFPGVVDEIVNLGEHWNQDKLRISKAAIIEATKENSRLFQKAYGYLKASGKLYEAYEQTVLKCFSNDIVPTLSSQIIEKINSRLPTRKSMGHQRDLFAFSITPKGIIDFRSSVLETVKVKIRIKEDRFSTSETLMNHLKDDLLQRGLDIICLHSPFKVGKILDIVIDEIDVVISVENDYYKHNHDNDFDVDLTKLVLIKTKETIQNEINDDINHFDELLQCSINYIKKAKENHDTLERFYVEAMDFSKHDELLTKLIQTISVYK